MSVCLYEFRADNGGDAELYLMADNYEADVLWLADDDNANLSRCQGQQLLQALLIIYGGQQ